MNYLKPFFQVAKLQYSDDDIDKINNLIPKNTSRILIIQDSNVQLKLPLEDYEIVTEKVDVTNSEPTVLQIDELTSKLDGYNFDCIIGVGGGSCMDIAKSLSITLNDKSFKSAGNYQGWDLVFHEPIYKIGVPTLFGSGSESSRTAVLSSKEKKQGINSEHSMFDAVFLMPGLDYTAAHNQRFYSGMDCYIHCIESSQGNFINSLSKIFADQALEICEKFFLHNDSSANMALASYFGGVSIVNSEVGICHALSYGLSQELGIRHGLANCLVFDKLEEFYGEYVLHFRKMLKTNNINLPQNLCARLTKNQVKKMIEATYRMEKPLLNALGDNYKNILTESKIREIYSSI